MTPYFAPPLLLKKTLGTTLALTLAALSLPVDAQGPAIVGEATMVIGVAKLVGSDGVPRVFERGTSVRVGERIQTELGGHVHLRFVDGGRLSIRPSSSLQIEDYSHSQGQPALGAIKFRLDEGVVRSITGSWGEAARDRFRLNTPVAAIGVKGTDFVVKTQSDKTSASVYTGAITLTPLAGTCSNSVGPCLNGFEKVLSEDMKGQMVEFNQRQITPQLVPLIDLLARNNRSSANGDVVTARLEKPLVIENSQNESRSANNTLVIDNQAASITAAPAAAAVAAVAAIAAAPVPPPALVPPIVVVAPAPPLTAVVAPAPAPPVPAPPAPAPPAVVIAAPQVNQLFWSRYIWVRTVEGDNFTRDLGQALAAADYGKLSSNGDYLLFRPNAAPGTAITSPDAIANFRLADSTAQLAPKGGRAVELVNVNDGTLSVDFTRATFATRLGLSNPSIGSEAIVASGTVTSGGMLQTVNTNAAITGGLSLDGKEAAYAFDKAIAAGTLRGVTLWGR